MQRAARDDTRSRRRSGVLLTFALLGLSAAAQGAGGSLAPGTHDLRLRVGERDRSAILYLPATRPDADPDAERPLLIAFHGGGGRGADLREVSGLDAVADREGFAVVYPDGSGRFGRRLLTWNAGRCCGEAMRAGVDDVAFARALVDEVARRTPIDRTRVYATGHSNGAMMSYRLAAEAPDLVAAIAPVGGAMILERFEAREPMPVLHVHSVDDPRAPYAGGLGPPFPLTRSRVRHNPVESELHRWVRLGGCPDEPVQVEERRDPASGHTAVHLRFAPCESGVEVELWRLTGAGHGWPGGHVGRRQRIVGPDTRVLSAAEEVWRFVSRFRRRPASAAGD